MDYFTTMYKMAPGNGLRDQKWHSTEIQTAN